MIESMIRTREGEGETGLKSEGRKSKTIHNNQDKRDIITDAGRKF